MNYILSSLQIIVSLLLAGVILLQAKGSGLSATFGGSSFQRSRRGFDKLLFNITIVLSLIFIASSLANVFLA